MSTSIPEINVEAIHHRRKREWMNQERARRRDFMRAIENSVPWWLVAIAVVMFVLSAPHTAAIFNKLTPGWGWIAPVGVEFGLLYAAFRRKQNRMRHQRPPVSLWLLEALLFITAVVVNGAGSLQSVVNSDDALRELSLVVIIRQFATLPATVQIGFALVPLAAFIIPIGTGVTGEGLASLILERRAVDDGLEDAWRDVMRAELYQALFAEYTRRGTPPITARQEALALSSGYAGATPRTPRTTAPRVLPDGVPDSVLAVPERAQVASATVPKLRVPDSGQDKRQLVRDWLQTHPDQVAELSYRRLADAISQDTGQAISKTMVGEIIPEFKTGPDTP